MSGTVTAYYIDMNTTQTKDPAIAETIRQQIGRKALFMLGAKNLIDVGNGLSFRVRGSRTVNYIAIELDAGTDTYSVRTAKIGRAPNFKVSNDQTATFIYADQLHSLIESTTGLRTSL